MPFTFEFDQGVNSEFIKSLWLLRDAKGGQWSYVINQDFLNSLGIKGTWCRLLHRGGRYWNCDKIENTFINITINKKWLPRLLLRTIASHLTKTPRKHARLIKQVRKFWWQEVQLGELIQYLLDGVTIPERHYAVPIWRWISLILSTTAILVLKGIIKGTEYTAEKDLMLPLTMLSLRMVVIKAGDKI